MKTFNTRQRNLDFIEACRRVIHDAECRGETPEPRTVVMRALYSKPPSYYLNYDTAMQIVSRMGHLTPEERDALPRRIANIRARHVLADIETIRRLNPAMHRSDAVTYLLYKGNPRRFYISMRQAMTLFHKNFKLRTVYTRCIS